MERVLFMQPAYNAASHQGANTMYLLHFSGTLVLNTQLFKVLSI